MKRMRIMCVRKTSSAACVSYAHTTHTHETQHPKRNCSKFGFIEFIDAGQRKMIFVYCPWIRCDLLDTSPSVLSDVVRLKCTSSSTEYRTRMIRFDLTGPQAPYGAPKFSVNQICLTLPLINFSKFLFTFLLVFCSLFTAIFCRLRLRYCR